MCESYSTLSRVCVCVCLLQRISTVININFVSKVHTSSL